MTEVDIIHADLGLLTTPEERELLSLIHIFSCGREIKIPPIIEPTLQPRCPKKGGGAAKRGRQAAAAPLGFLSG